jgi:hypothetical protein
MSPKLREDLARSQKPHPPETDANRPRKPRLESNSPDSLMDITLTRGFLGGVSKMTIHRWKNTLADFPQPMRIFGRNFWRKGDLLAFLDAQRRKSERARAPVAHTNGPPSEAVEKPAI